MDIEHRRYDTVAADVLDEARVKIEARALTADGGYCSVYGFVAPLPPDLEYEDIIDAKPREFNKRLPDEVLEKLEQMYRYKTEQFKIAYELLLLGHTPSTNEVENISNKFNVENEEVERALRKLRKTAYFKWL